MTLKKPKPILNKFDFAAGWRERDESGAKKTEKILVRYFYILLQKVKILAYNTQVSCTKRANSHL